MNPSVTTPEGLVSALTGVAPTPSSTTSEPSFGDTAKKRPFVSVTPQLGIQIPGLEFSPAVEEGGVVNVPFLAQYIAAMYRYAVGIVVIVSIVMVVFGGFRYMVGSSFSDVNRGKEIIMDAIIGMLLVLGAYTILNTINDNTLNLEAFEFKNVEATLGLVDNESEEVPGENVPEDGSDSTEGLTNPSTSISSGVSTASVLPTRNTTPVQQADPNVAISSYVRFETECLHLNTPVHPVMERYLRQFSDNFCRLRGSNTGWKVYCGGFRRIDQQLTFWIRRCLNKTSCHPPTGMPLQKAKKSLVHKDSEKKYVVGPGNVRDAETARGILLPWLDRFSGAHTSGVAVDCHCNVNRSGTAVFHAPCNRVLEQAMSDAGMCRIRTEHWHFEPNQYRVSRFTCIHPVPIGLVQENAKTPLNDYRNCQGQFSYSGHRCLE
jgi:hypothetical protein